MERNSNSIMLKILNEYISCGICKGYLIDATTITECLHTFCKSCLVKYLQEKKACPSCSMVIHQSHPLQYISHDRTLQDIVYKLVPNLQENEIKKEKNFYIAKGLCCPKNRYDKSSNENDANSLVENTNHYNYHREDEQVGLLLLASSQDLLKQIRSKFIRCSAQATITHLKKFIAMQLFKTKDRHKEIDILYNDELLGKDHTLKFVYVTRWRFKSGPLMLYYRPSQELFN